MGCQHYGDRGGAEWCQHYGQPIRDLKSQPVQVDEEIVVDVVDIHESGAGIGRTEDGFIIMVDGVLPEARARVKISKVKSNHARADPIERLSMDPDEEAAAEGDESSDGEETDEADERSKRPPRLGSRDNFWGS
jgi:predicted RNA-binding protein with TRAM domain